MSDNKKINNLFASMTPVRKTRGDEESKFSLFALRLIAGEPFLMITSPGKDRMSMPAHVARIYNEVERINESSEDTFGRMHMREYGNPKASIWDNPYLLNLFLGKVGVSAPDGHAILATDRNVRIRLSVRREAGDLNTFVKLILTIGDEETDDFVFLDDTHILNGHMVYEIKSAGDNYMRLRSLVAPIKSNQLEEYLTLFLTYSSNILPELNGIEAQKSPHKEEAVPTIFLEKVAVDKALYLRAGLSLESLGGYLPEGVVPGYTVNIDDKDRITIREVAEPDMDSITKKLEMMILAAAPDRTARKEIYRKDSFFIIPEATAGPFLLNYLPDLLNDFKLVGSEKLKEYRIVTTQPRLNLKLSSGIDFLEGEGDVEIDSQHFSISDILNQYARKRYVTLSDGSRGIVDEGYISKLQRLFRRRDKNGKIRVTIFDFPEVEEMINSQIRGSFASRTREVLAGFNDLRSLPAPDYKVNATLRPYQNEGVKWLKYLYDNKLGGCLADDMGLGKTLQTISLLSMIYPGARRPSLIVMPRSLLFNWERELKKFAPEITFSEYYGPGRNLQIALNKNVVLSSYAVVRNDIEKLKDVEFECIVLDESQNIKTLSSQTATSVQLLSSKHRFALSGTPMENNLTELYSLFRFLNPPMFGTLEDFNASYTYPIQKRGDKDATLSLRRKIFPFIMRRLKKDVLDDLPPRIDQTLYVEMSEQQKQFYDDRRKTFRQEIKTAIARDGAQKSQFLMFQALSELRRIASVPESMSDGKINSPKIEELVETLIASVDNGHKSVVFFNFIAGLELVGTHLEKHGIDYETMTGSTSTVSRKKSVDRFQTDPECKIMLLTLKVGGVGLNLTAADTVFMFEPWWNKAAEEQAINRLHRIGQKKTVSSYSLISIGTIEEKILELQEQKSELFNELISADGSSSKYLSEKDIDFILS